MAWYRNDYECEECCEQWTDEWSCGSDDECPRCGLRDMSPSDSEDRSEVVEASEGFFVVLASPDDAEDDPNYLEIGHFLTLSRAISRLKEVRQIRLRREEACID